MLQVLALGFSALTILSVVLFICVGGAFFGTVGFGGMIVFPLLTVLFVRAERDFLGKDAEESTMQGDGI